MTDLLSEINPFATCRTRPGAIPFFFPPGQSAGQLIEKLRENGWWGEIVGPHGSGKSTLLATLAAELRGASIRLVAFQLHDDCRQLLHDWQHRIRAERPSVLAIDGYEQLGAWNRFRVRRLCRRGGIGLLVTAHETAGLPVLYRTCVTPELARRVVKHLLAEKRARILPEEIDARLDALHGNLRELLFELFDLHELRRPQCDFSQYLLEEPRHDVRDQAASGECQNPREHDFAGQPPAHG